MKIQDPDYVLRLWASAVRPSVKRAQPTGFDRRGSGDDRRLQARVKVESCARFRKYKPVLWAWFVVECQTTMRDRRIVAVFKAELKSALRESPIIVGDSQDDLPESAGYFLPFGDALSRLEEAYGERVMSERKLASLVASGFVTSYKQGRVRMVDWSDVVKFAPRKRRQRNPRGVAA